MGQGELVEDVRSSGSGEFTLTGEGAMTVLGNQLDVATQALRKFTGWDQAPTITVETATTRFLMNLGGGPLELGSATIKQVLSPGYRYLPSSTNPEATPTWTDTIVGTQSLESTFDQIPSFTCSVSGTMTGAIVGEELVNLATRSLSALHVTHNVSMTLANCTRPPPRDTSDAVQDLWFARGVGLVKLTSKAGKQDLSMLLVDSSLLPTQP